MAGDAGTEIKEKVVAVCRHELEREAVAITEIYAKGVKWPYSRATLRVEFMAEHANIVRRDIGGMKFEGREGSGKAVLFFNFGYLVQRYREYLEHVVPMGLALLLGDISAAVATGDKPPKDWIAWFKDITGRDPLDTATVSAMFDPTAQKFQAGYLPAMCACPRPKGFRLVDPTKSLDLTRGQLACPTCKRPFMAVVQGETTPLVQAERAFLVKELARRTRGGK